MSDYVHLPDEEKKIKLRLEDWSLIVALSRRQPIYDEVMKLSEEDRITLSAYPTRESDWFKPKGAKDRPVKGYPRSWWDKLTLDEKNFYQATCVLKEQILGEVEEVYEVVDFYALVTESTALAWYHHCPPHLRVRIDKEIDKVNIRTVTREEDEALWDAVSFALGDRPRMQYSVVAGHTEIRSYFQLAVYKRWGVMYRRELIKRETLRLAPIIQKERRMLNEAMGINVESGDLPSQAEGLDNVASATVRWLQESGEMPLEFLARTYRSEEAKMSDRLTAAKTLMDYVHRKIPQKQEIESKGKLPSIDPSLFSGLSAKELETLEKLLNKLTEEK